MREKTSLKALASNLWHVMLFTTRERSHERLRGNGNLAVARKSDCHRESSE
jgi:hypothetical protein